MSVATLVAKFGISVSENLNDLQLSALLLQEVDQVDCKN